jgi:hypothetical protein
MRNPPSYVVKSGALELPLKFPWDGEGMHYGPSQGTKLHDALDRLTARGLAVLAALAEEWLTWRLHKGVDAERILHHVDAVLAWAIDRYYLDQSSLKGSIPKDTPVNQALGDGVWMVRQVAEDDQWDHPILPRADRVYALINITKQTMPDKEKKAFMAWVTWATETGAKLDPRPKKRMPAFRDFESNDAYRTAVWPYFGTKALPREAFDPESEYKPEQREELLNRFLAGLDWKKNPFLRSPEDMKKLGFQGTPYKL